MGSKLAGIVLGAALMATPSFAQKIDRKTEPLANIGASLDLGSRSCHVENAPLEVRSVPKHPDDGYAGYAPPIRDKRLGCPYGHFDLISELGLRHVSGDKELSFGGNLGWHIASDSSIARSNYTNAVGTEQRGYGAALTWYGTMDSMSLDDVFYGAFVQFKKGRLFFRGDANFEKFNLQTGWDRYDSLETRKSYVVGHTITPSFTIGLEQRSGHITGRVYAKASYGMIEKNNLGKDMKIESHPSISAGIAVLFGK
jgi:hypothetical protein